MLKSIMTVLDKIIEKRRERLKEAKRAIPIADIKARIREAAPPEDFHAAIKKGKKGSVRLIAELKKASPSKGLIRPDFNPAQIASVYGEFADAVSVLTEPDFFQGDIGYIDIVKTRAKRPALRKDFIFDEYQVLESRAFGADAILLIARALERAQAADYLAMAAEMGMAVLFEVHDMFDLEKALRIDATIIGVNNRDLATLKTDINRTPEMIKEIPSGRTVVAESAVENRADMLFMEEAGADAALVGTAIMKAADIASKLKELKGIAG